MLPMSLSWPAAWAPTKVAERNMAGTDMPAWVLSAINSWKRSGQGSLQIAMLSVPVDIATPARYAWRVIAPPTVSLQLPGDSGGVLDGPGGGGPKVHTGAAGGGPRRAGAGGARAGAGGGA